MSERDWKYEPFKLSKGEAVLFALALPFVFIIATFGSAISALFSKKS